MAMLHLSTSPALAQSTDPPIALPSASSHTSYKVTIVHDGRATTIDVDPNETILAKALDSSLIVPHDYKLGVCMMCPVRLVSGEVDQSEGMLSDNVVVYRLLCASYPR
uniref:2Fe-2S ferredoxin-type domain-containing protein n=1 Tax=Nelumbo nucifera TaxID=4432 RepID=A0A822XNV3_NELNU|nr:TPA_asm: hypothetical protein HUJ06_020651 [Nelumbo nucifera]